MTPAQTTALKKLGLDGDISNDPVALGLQFRYVALGNITEAVKEADAKKASLTMPKNTLKLVVGKGGNVSELTKEGD